MRHDRSFAVGSGALGFGDCVNLELALRRARGVAEGTALCVLDILF